MPMIADGGTTCAQVEAVRTRGIGGVLMGHIERLGFSGSHLGMKKYL